MNPTQLACFMVVGEDAGPFVGLFVNGDFLMGFDPERARSVAARLQLMADKVEVLKAAGGPYPEGMHN